LDETPDIDIPVVLEKEDYLVINKPKWVLSHPNSVWDVSQPSVVGFLYHKYKDLPTVWNFIRAWLVHRLDKDTDGLMIIAKTEKWLAYFKELFQQKSGLVAECEDIELVEKEIKFKKFYRAKSEITALWDAFLEKIKDNLPYYIRENVVPKVPNCIVKMWVTKILDFKIDWEFVDLNLEILTGRTHQIRYHLSNHWLPIVWDYLYWNESDIPMQLTAYRLEFTDVDWKNVCLSL
jgi:23S rRNA pseudouridine1911/1915/1917 synthase